MGVLVCRIERWISASLRGLRHAWVESEAAQEALVDVNMPWWRDGASHRRSGSGISELPGNRFVEVPPVP